MRKPVVQIILIVLFVQNASSTPYNRVKRVSDQRLAELETLVGLSKMSGKLVTVPLGYGKLDPKFIGRRRRSQSAFFDKLFNTSSEEDSGSGRLFEPPELDYADILYKKR